MSPRRRLRTRYERERAPASPGPSGPSTASAVEPPVLVPAHAADAETAAEGTSTSERSVAPPADPASGPPLVGAVETRALVPAAEPAASSVAIPLGPPGGSAGAFEVQVTPSGPPAAVIEPARARPHRARALLALAGFALLAFVTGLIVFNNLLMPRIIHGVGQVAVPDLTNLTVDQAEQALRPLGLQLSRAGERFDPAVPRGFVLTQDPEAGTTVRGRKRISVVVSLGEEWSSAPELFGESVRGARLLIERAGLVTGAIVHAPSEDVGEGLVAGSDPGPESVLQRATPVHLLVSTGAGEESFVMPDVAGREIGGVRRQLEALGFRVTTPPAAPSLGTIVSQEPAAGSRITRETVIQLQATGRMIR